MRNLARTAVAFLFLVTACSGSPTRLAGPLREGEHGEQEPSLPGGKELGRNGLGTGRTAVTLPTGSSGPAASSDAPGFYHYAAPSAFPQAHSAGETSIGVNPASNAAMFLMSLNTARVVWNDASSPAAAVWTNVSYPLTSKVTLDPILWTDRATGRTFVVQLEGEASLTAYTDDDGATWHPGGLPSAAPAFDHESVGGGVYAQPAPPGAARGYPNALYYCAQTAISQCARSDDGGTVWGPPVPSDQLACSGIHGHIVVGPDGSVYLPKRQCPGGVQGLRVSRDNGLTWETSKVPGTNGLTARSDPAAAFDNGGRLYFATSSGGNPVVATSTDGGRTWSTPVDVGAAFGIRNAEFPMVVGGDAGRAAFAFYGTTTGGNDQAAAFDGVWHLYVAYTFDGGATWQTVDTTPADPVQRGCIWLGGGDNECRNLLDFQGMTMDAQGRVLVGYADGCTTSICKGARGTPDKSRDSLGTIARQTVGKRLYAAFDPA
jgi:hypothetical protein